MKKKRKRTAPEPVDQYVIGCHKDGFCWLVPAVSGQSADDQNLELAQTFSSLPEAIDASTDRDCNVFEVVEKEGGPAIEEIMVDLHAIESMPFDGCYPLMDGLIAGPSFIGQEWRTTETRILRLAAARIDCIISLVSKGELFWHQGQVGKLLFEDDRNFRQHFFPIVDAAVPTRELMLVILDTIDTAIERKQKVFLHCIGGRGRTGLVAACYAARHGVATGERVLNWLAKRRYQYGLFRPSPETEEQREFVRQWKEGQ